MPRSNRKRPSMDSAVTDTKKRRRQLGNRPSQSMEPVKDDDAAAKEPQQLMKYQQQLFPLPQLTLSSFALSHTSEGDALESLREVYCGMPFPRELLLLHQFCCSKWDGNSSSLSQAEAITVYKSALLPLGLEPCGPFDFLLLKQIGALATDESGAGFDWLTHCRFLHDPPEFLTLFIASEPECATDCVSSSELHIGYVRDSPELAPAFLAANDAAKDGVFARLGENICRSLSEFTKSRAQRLPQAARAGQQRLLAGLADFLRHWGLDAASCEASSGPSATLKRRDKASVAPTLNRLGLCVPISAGSDGVGYRELPETDADLRRLLRRVASKCDALGSSEAQRQARLVELEPVDELVTLVQFANDEGDTGMGIELGLDLLSVATETGCYDDLIEGLLTTGYRLLGRQLYADIVARHMQGRRRYRERARAEK